ncbi:hypothetical protein [Arvimicrobium flavum]|uniref:hypothetical protein n=1 Tax=Arvimicrobium flavum TaxID=3393320 RepID=UPI00237B64E4|nr:hypothetical protein [Mesorhizobium shangrilense]
MPHNNMRERLRAASGDEHGVEHFGEPRLRSAVHPSARERLLAELSSAGMILLILIALMVVLSVASVAMRNF